MSNKYSPENHRRRSIRLQGYDYSQAGAYFVTVCTQNRKCLFGAVIDGEMLLNDCGKIAAECLDEIPKHFPHVEMDEFVVMPNHVHLVVVIVDGPVGATHASPLPQPPRGPQPRSIGSIIGSYKSAVTKRVNEIRDTRGAPIWQRNYYEHIIRDENELHRVRRYIESNPACWADDENNPLRVKET